MFKIRSFGLNKKIITVMIVVVIGFAWIYTWPWLQNSPNIRETDKSFFILGYSMDWNYYQTKNDCGPFSLAAAYRILKQQNVDSAEFVREMPWRIPERLTFPTGLEQLARQKGLQTSTPSLIKLSNSERVRWLESELSQGRPVIILGGFANSWYYRHYVTVLGYSKQGGQTEYYLYDSLQKKSENNEKMTIDATLSVSGNKVLSESQLLDFWSRGGIAGVYQWYGLSLSND
ncbi:MAG: C39 family peptidase [Patescibacteria group bacterium]